MALKFPENLYFGAATSAHQVEGGNNNDWTEWEHATAKLKVESSKLKVWPDFILRNYPNPLQEENYISGRACDHYNRFREDFDIAKSLGHNAHRFSIEWSRIEPEEGKFDQKEIEHYREVLHALRERGMEPFVTLWHWTLPLWVSEKGGWESKETIFYFSRYCKRLAEAFRTDVKFFIPLNEPGLWSGDSYLFGIKPPQKRNFFLLILVYFNLLKAHKEAYRVMKKINPEFSIGIAESGEWTEFLFLPPSLQKLVLFLRNFLFLRQIRQSLDFAGINYYRRNRLFRPPIGKVSDLGWEVYPEGLYKIIMGVWRRYNLPIFVTENGIADARDALRVYFIREHIVAVQKAMNEGADVRGYFHWSLLDNFEWDSGFWPRFGLVGVDYKTQERKIRESAKIFKQIIKSCG